jgi:hypothetical protein
VRCCWLLLTCLTGCFVQTGISYAPGAKIGVQRTTDPSMVTHTESATTFNFRIGFHLDFFIVGPYYAPYAPRVTRGVNGFPKNFAPRGDYLRLDVDLPVAFGPNKAFLLRASYAHQRFSKAGSHGVNWDAEGSGNWGGLTVASFNRDLSLNVLLGKYSFTTMNADVGWPNFSMEAFDIDVGLTFRFIPTGFLIRHYVYQPGPAPDVGRTTSSCGYAYYTGGYSCSL